MKLHWVPLMGCMGLRYMVFLVIWCDLCSDKKGKSMSLLLRPLFLSATAKMTRSGHDGFYRLFYDLYYPVSEGEGGMEGRVKLLFSCN